MGIVLFIIVRKTFLNMDQLWLTSESESRESQVMEERRRLAYSKSTWSYTHLRLGPGRSVLTETLQQNEKRIELWSKVETGGKIWQKLEIRLEGTNTRSIREEKSKHDTGVVSLTSWLKLNEFLLKSAAATRKKRLLKYLWFQVFKIEWSCNC